MKIQTFAALLACAAIPAAHASTPASHDVTIPTSDGQVVVVEWTGTALPGSSGSANMCPPSGPDDFHTINLTVPDGAYEALDLTVNADFHIDWDIGTPDPSGSFTDPDLVLSVVSGTTTLGSSDGGAPEENVGLSNLPSGSYNAIACPFAASQPTDYRGKLTLTARANKACAISGPTKALSHADATPSPGSAWNPERTGLANFDLARAATPTAAVPVPAGFDGRLRNSLFDRKLGTPTFLWARSDAPIAAVGALQARELLVERARAHLRDEAKRLKLSAAMIADATVIDAQYNGAGPAVVRFRQAINGREVFNRTLNVLLDRNGKPIAVSGYFATDYDASLVPGTVFARSAPQAIAAAWGNLGGVLDANLLARTATRGDYEIYSTPNLPGTHQFERAPRSKALYYPVGRTLEPAYFVELFAHARANQQLIAYAFVVSAVDGRILHRDNLKADAAYSYRVFAGAAGPLYQPYDMPLGNGYTPFPGSNPNDPLVRTGVDTNLVTLSHAGIVTGDPWLPDNATETVGNNVDACLDTFDNAANGVLSTPTNTCDPDLGDVRPAPNGDHSFDYPITADSDPSTPDAQAAAVVNLFYINNWLHDWWYNHGFNEAAGNAQTDNFDRGGQDGDPIKAQGQDSSGRNNANMSTPSDGSSPTMQQYLFDGPPIGEVRETSPRDSGPLKWAPAAFGPDSYDIAQEIVLADDGSGVSPSDGCGETADPSAPTPAAPAQASLAGKIALIDRGNCNFTAKAQFASSSGAAGMIVVNNTDGEPIPMGNGDIPVSGTPSVSDPAYQIASVMIRKADGNAIKTDRGSGAVTGHMQREPSTDVDGTLDNQIIAHEFFHYVHHRLTNSSNQQADAMSEGWGDISAFMLSARANDRQASGNDAYQGAYALAGYVANNFYTGIRRAPYSTDFSKNAFTFRHISDGEPTPDGGPGSTNSEVHNAGEIWANMVWECYVGILNQPRHRFEQARDRMQGYIIGGMKMTPADATYTEARDAILSVVLASDFEDYKACSDGFARRGNGLNAVAPDRASTDLVGVVENYEPFVAAPNAPPCGTTPSRYSIFGGSLPLGSLLGLGLVGLRRRWRGNSIKADA